MGARIPFALAALGLSSIAHAADCEYAGQSFTLGATICECPSLTGEGGLASGGSAHLTSRRLVCKPSGWASADSLCVDLSYASSSGVARDDLDKLNNQYCPRLPINHDEIERAVSQETAKFFITAPKPSIVIALQTICARFRLGTACQALLDAILAVR